MTEPSHAVFLSYASQDAEAAQRICEALRVAGIEVWFDQSALRGGDVWDQTIRKQIKSCVLFIPVISKHTQARDEGYFRLEWKLAVDRSHLMTADKAFLLPVVIDDTPEDDERVPDKFRDVQWTRLQRGETPSGFVERVRRLVSPEPSQVRTTTVRPAGSVSPATPPMRERVPASWRLKGGVPAIAAVVVLGALAYLAVDKLWILKHPAPPPAAPTLPPGATPAAFAPPPHSIAVLPFVNMSGDKQQEYFSDGLTEEILNSLVRINELQVSARTSAFSFKGKDVKISTIARELNVGSILEGSVRRSGHTIRVTAQLNNAVTGFHLWSQTYDRDLSDVLKLQTEIANAVASALKVTLLGDVTTKVEVGGTRSAAAFDAYLRASKAYRAFQTEKGLQGAITAYTEAIRLDSEYALAYADRSLAYSVFAQNYATAPAVPEYVNKSQADARKAIALAPDLAEGHLALASALKRSLEFARVSEEYERALALAPGNARVLQAYGLFAVAMGRTDAGLAAVRRAVALDPLSPGTQYVLGQALMGSDRYREAIVALKDAKTLAPDDVWINAWLGFAYYYSGDVQRALATCEGLKGEDDFNKLYCLALTYHKLGRYTDADAVFTKLRASSGGESAVLYALIYSEWGDKVRALDWLETALHYRDPDLVYVKKSFDSLRKEPRFQAIERELKFPN